MLVVALVVVVAVVGFYLWSLQNRPLYQTPTPPTPIASQKTTPVTQQENPLTKNWKTFESKELGISFKYPGDWKKPEISKLQIGNSFVDQINLSNGFVWIRTKEAWLAKSKEPSDVPAGFENPNIERAIDILEMTSKGKLTGDLEKEIEGNLALKPSTGDLDSVMTRYNPNLNIYGLEIIGRGGYAVSADMFFWRTFLIKNNKVIGFDFGFFQTSPLKSQLEEKIGNGRSGSESLIRTITDQLKTQKFNNDEIGQTLKKNLEIYEAIAQSVKFLD